MQASDKIKNSPPDGGEFWLSHCVVLSRGHWGRRLDCRDAIVPRGIAAVLLAGADDLVVSGFEHEVWLGTLGNLALEACIIGGILLDRLNAVQGPGFGLVHLAGEDLLAVVGVQRKEELAIARLLELELRHGSLLGCGNRGCLRY